MQQLWASILMFTIFSIFTQSAQGSTYGIVPYVNPAAPGAVTGIVAAGAATGAVCFGLGFRQLSNPKDAFYLMAGAVVVSGFMSIFITIKGHRGILFGQDIVHNVNMLNDNTIMCIVEKQTPGNSVETSATEEEV
jgi:NNP family nitrate/nitrite transporter-like MFS transporter